MRLVKSICTNLVFPDSRKDIEEFRRMAEYLSGKGVKSIEFYHDGKDRSQTGKVLSDCGLEGVYIAVIPSKEQQLYLCDPDDGNRAKAVAMLCACLDEAHANGMTRVLINSGRITEDINRGLAALKDSIGRLYDHAETIGMKLELSLEPCDSGMDAFHLIGPYQRAVAFVKDVRESGLPMELTIDSAHTVEEGEHFLEALKAAKPYCTHVHFANCRIADPGDPLYGDKHVGFEYSGTVWSAEKVLEAFKEMENVYPGDAPLRVALEVLCREDDPYAYFDRMWSSLPFMSGANA